MRKEIAMATRSSFAFDNLLSLSRYTLLGLLLLMTSACHRGANLIPWGYEGVFNDDARASQAARVDYPVVVTDPTKYTIFRVTEKGERIWFYEMRFWKDEQSWWDFSPSWYRIFVQVDNLETPLCVSPWIARTQEIQEIDRCTFTATDYLAKPLAVTLLYKLGGDAQQPPADTDVKVGVVSRYFYLFPR
jgi:hypothetical protein